MVASASNSTVHAKRCLDVEQLAHLLSADARQFQLEIVNETGSTSTDLIERWRANHALIQPLARLAYLQTQGRGRLGRTWFGSAGDALLFSIAYLIPRPVNELAGLSLATGSAILNGLRTLPLAEPRRLALKWPNDVLLDGAKLAGILIETAWHTSTSSAIVIGIGLNLHGEDTLTRQLSMSPHSSPAARPPAVLAQALPEVSMTSTFTALLNALATMLKRFSAEGFTPFQQAWNADHAYAGQHVSLLEQGVETTHGIVTGIDSLGRLLIDSENGIQQITSGELSLRLRPTQTRDKKPPSEISG